MVLLFANSTLNKFFIIFDFSLTFLAGIAFLAKPKGYICLKLRLNAKIMKIRLAEAALNCQKFP